MTPFKDRPILKVVTAGLVSVLLICLTIALSAYFISNKPSYIQNNTGVDGKPVNNISVSATGKVTVKPDVVNFVLGYTTNKDNVSDVQKDMNNVNNNLRKSLNENGIQDADIQTTSFDIRPNFIYSSNGNSQLNGHQGVLRLTVKVKNISKAGEIIDKSVKAGASTVDSINFALDNDQSAKSDARDKAVKAAKSKADELAKSSGVSVGGLISINETESSPVTPYYNDTKLNVATAEGSGSTNLATGSLDVIININATYGIK